MRIADENNNNNGYEINVEGLAAEQAARYPFDDPEACREVHDAVWIIVKSMLGNRAKRLKT